jgi:hypothetical protein
VARTTWKWNTTITLYDGFPWNAANVIKAGIRAKQLKPLYPITQQQNIGTLTPLQTSGIYRFVISGEDAPFSRDLIFGQGGIDAVAITEPTDPMLQGFILSITSRVFTIDGDIDYTYAFCGLILGPRPYPPLL